MTFRKIALAAGFFLVAASSAGAASLTVAGPVISSNGPFPGGGVEVFLELDRDAVDIDPRPTHSRFDSVVSGGFVAIDGVEVFTFAAPAFSSFSFFNLDSADDAFDFSSVEWRVGDGVNFEITGGLGTDLGVFNNAPLSVFHSVLDLIDNRPADIWFGNGGTVVIQSAGLDFDYAIGEIAVAAVPLPAGLPLIVAALAAFGAVRYGRLSAGSANGAPAQGNIRRFDGAVPTA